MRGQRVQTHAEFWDAPPGSYMSVSVEDAGERFETWLLKCPNGHAMYVAFDPREGPTHDVDEHDDGTISVQPKPGNSNSILCSCGWHGYIDHGVWGSV